MSRDAGAGTLNDERELAALCVAYAVAVDTRDGDRLAELFVEDGELVVPKVPVDLRPVLVRQGSEALRQIPDGLRRFTKTFHEVLNREFTIEGGAATGVVYCVAHHVTAAEAGPQARGGTDAVWYIRYLDHYQRTTSGWRITRRELHLEWVEERPVALIS
ncbi:MAG TPA: nuclear transport factor 2 family protein [Acidimicrobiales bacterium]|nr:nuclear transport factor 2 family protein [Acidimicrobiales bacterium]